MSIFCLKKLTAHKLAGEKLKETREKMGWSVKRASQETHIAEKYLTAIEKGSCRDLPPAKAHCLAYVKKYAAALGLNVKSIANKFAKETGLDHYQLAHPRHYLKIKPLNSIFVWVKKISIAVLVLAFIAYLSWQVYGILQPPALLVYSPDEGHIINKLATVVQGKTDSEVKLTINGKDITTNERGQFEAAVDLSKGINTITISATKKHGKTTTVTRHVIVKDPSAQNKLSYNQ